MSCRADEIEDARRIVACATHRVDRQTAELAKLATGAPEHDAATARLHQLEEELELQLDRFEHLTGLKV
jgi:hypothetical protein